MKVLKIIFFALLFFFWIFSLFATPGTAMGGDYILMEDIPSVAVQNPDFPEYLAAIYKTGVILAAVLAVLMIVIGGIQYMLAGGNPGKLGDAKDTIWQAILGLLLILGSYLILNTINPDLVAMKLPSLTTLTTTTATPPPATPTPGVAPPGTTPCGAGFFWEDASSSCIPLSTTP